MATQQEFDAIIKEVLGNRNRGASKSSPEYQAARDTAAKRMSGGRSSAFKPSTDKADMQSKSGGKKSSGGGKKKSKPSRGAPVPSQRIRTPETMNVPEGTGTRGEPAGGSDLSSWLPLLLAALGSAGAYAGINRIGRPAKPDAVAAGMSQTRAPDASRGPVDPVAAGMEDPRMRGGTPPPPPPAAAAATPPVRGAVTIEDADMGDIDPRVTEMIERARRGMPGAAAASASPTPGWVGGSQLGPVTTAPPTRFRAR
jgi:hypothetical protein